MSQIFDALHQSATERSGSGSREFSAAKELLQVVERKQAAGTAVLEAQPAVDKIEAARNYPLTAVDLAAHAKFVSFEKKDSLAAEKFRFLATRLRHLQQKRSLRRLVVTSSVPGEGKSMVAANLACALALGKQEVLLLEGDLRKPSLGQQLGLRDLPGLGQALRADDESANIYRLEGKNLCVLLAGGSYNNPLEFMDSNKLSAMLDRIAKGFDWFIIDSPPVLPLADTSIWMRLADAILLVARPGVTPKRQLQSSIDAIEQSKLLGTVVNASSETTANHYYYQYSPASERTSTGR
jgi:capsular exopolysaccharide synthesis family protein